MAAILSQAQCVKMYMTNKGHTSQSDNVMDSFYIMPQHSIHNVCHHSSDVLAPRHDQHEDQGCQQKSGYHFTTWKINKASHKYHLDHADNSKQLLQKEWNAMWFLSKDTHWIQLMLIWHGMLLRKSWWQIGVPQTCWTTQHWKPQVTGPPIGSIRLGFREETTRLLHSPNLMFGLCKEIVNESR